MTGTPVISIVLVFTAAMIGSMGAVFLKLGAEPLRYGWRNALNVKLAAGVALFLGSSVFYLLGIRRGELSVLFPMVSISYVLGAFWSKVFFGEQLTKAKFLGLALIMLGVVFVGLGKQ
jgi:drug/metabolite transporter (DMT)-like permease